MLVDGKRCCDVCYVEITKGAKYVAHEIAIDEIPTVLVDRDMSVAGNVQIDICLRCRDTSGMSGTEVIN